MLIKVKKFIENNIDLINNTQIYDVFKLACEDLSTNEIHELSEVLSTIDIETETIRWRVFEDIVKEYIKDNLNAPNFAKDKSNSWARLDYMMDGISNVGFGWVQAKQYVLEHAKQLGLHIRPLAAQYGWQGTGDYAFQWFDEDAFDKEYNYE